MAMWIKVITLACTFVEVVPGHEPTTTTTTPSPTTTTTAAPTPRPFCIGCGLQGDTMSMVSSVSRGRGKRVVGGTEAVAGSHPWMAAVITIMEDGTVRRCGGSLIKPRWVLTAASCVFNSTIKAVYVSLNDHDLSTSTELASLTYAVTKSIRHPFYKMDATSEEHDIALLDLGVRVEFTTPVKPVCLAIADDETSDTMGTILGWGRVSLNGPLSSKLIGATVPLHPRATCVTDYTNTPITHTITDNMICTLSTSGSDACQEDGGGPLLKKLADNRYVQLGVISFGYGCGTSPGVHTRVSQYVPWITSITSADAC